MALASVNTGTPDGTNGKPIAVVASEDASPLDIPAVAVLGNKTTYAEVARSGITAADAPAGGDLTSTGFAGTGGANLGDALNALTLACRATCDTASAAISGRLILYDASNNPIGMSEVVAFTSDATRRLGNATGSFVTQRVLVDCGQARKFRFYVESVGAGTWSLYVRPI